MRRGEAFDKYPLDAHRVCCPNASPLQGVIVKTIGVDESNDNRVSRSGKTD